MQTSAPCTLYVALVRLLLVPSFDLTQLCHSRITLLLYAGMVTDPLVTIIDNQHVRVQVEGANHTRSFLHGTLLSTFARMPIKGAACCPPSSPHRRRDFSAKRSTRRCACCILVSRTYLNPSSWTQMSCSVAKDPFLSGLPIFPT